MSEERPSDEQWYDEEIAPKLKEISDACKAKERSFLATVEFNADERGHTINMCEGASVAMTMQHILMRSRGNIDGFVMQVQRWAKAKGIDTSQSIVLSFLFR